MASWQERVAGQWPGIMPYHGFIQSAVGSCSKVLDNEMAPSPGHCKRIIEMGQIYWMESKWRQQDQGGGFAVLPEINKRDYVEDSDDG